MIFLSFAAENRINTFYKPLKNESMEVVTIEKEPFHMSANGSPSLPNG